MPQFATAFTSFPGGYLHLAARNGSLEVFESLVEAGAGNLQCDRLTLSVYLV